VITEILFYSVASVLVADAKVAADGEGLWLDFGLEFDLGLLLEFLLFLDLR
jgi:hypothetical protein|tara:strand:+ start:6007 stop:6159 length:153 start_codon:yes stop_codon:yes gene_type:complete